MYIKLAIVLVISLFGTTISFACVLSPNAIYLDEPNALQYGFRITSTPNNYCLGCSDYEFVAPLSRNDRALTEVRINTYYKDEQIALWFPDPQKIPSTNKYSASLETNESIHHEISFRYPSGRECIYDWFIYTTKKK